MRFMRPVRFEYIILILIVTLAFGLRLYQFDRQIADWHSWRQTDSVAVAANFYEHGYNPLYPQGYDMTPITLDGDVNISRYRYVEFPIYQTLVYVAYVSTGGITPQAARMVSILFSLGSLVLIYFLTRRYYGTVTSLLAALLFGVLPFNIFFSRTTLPEPSLVFFTLGMLYFVDRYIFEKRWWLFLLSWLFIACALLTKPMAVFFFLPLGYSYLRQEGLKMPPLRYWILGVLAVAPFVWWRWWMSFHPEGIPYSDWLFNGTHIRFRPAFFRWIIQDRLGREILTVSGTVLLVLGFILRPAAKAGYFFHWMLLAAFLYIVVFASGNVTHDYYQVIIVPSIVIFVARGMYLLLSGKNELLPRFFTIPFALFLFVIMIGLGWYEVKGLYQINNDAVVEAGEVANRLLPKDAVVLTNGTKDSTLLYHTHRNGFADFVGSIEDMKQRYGVHYYLSIQKDALTNEILDKYQLIKESPKYVIVDVTKMK
jgi:hypothetical protein